LSVEHLAFNLRDNAPQKSRQAVEACRNASSNFVVGPSTSSQAQYVVPLAYSHGLGVISHSATSSLLSDKDLYQGFARTAVADTSLAQAAARFIEYMRWNQVAVVYQTDAWGTGFADSLFASLRAAGGAPTASLLLVPMGMAPNEQTIRNAARQVAELGLKILFLVAFDQHVVPVIAEIERAIGGWSSHVIVRPTNSAAHTKALALNDIEARLLQGIIGASVQYRSPRQALFQEMLLHYMRNSFPHDLANLSFASQGGSVGEHRAEPPGNLSSARGGTVAEQLAALIESVEEEGLPWVTDSSNFVPQMYDAVWAAAVAAAAVLQDGQNSTRDLGARAVRAMRTPGAVPAFSGATLGNWTWKPNGDPSTDGLEFVFDGNIFDNRTGEVSLGVFLSWTAKGGVQLMGTVVWPDGTRFPHIPGDGNATLEDQPGYVLAIAVVPAVAVVVAALLFLRRRGLRENKWRIARNEVLLSPEKDIGLLGAGSFGTVRRGYYRGTNVAVKPLFHSGVAVDLTGSRRRWLSRMIPLIWKPSARTSVTPCEDWPPQDLEMAGEQNDGQCTESPSRHKRDFLSSFSTRPRALRGDSTIHVLGSRQRGRHQGGFFSIFNRSRSNNVNRRGTADACKHYADSSLVCGRNDLTMFRRYMETDFLHEIRVCVELQHPNLVMVMGCIVDCEGPPSLVTEYMEHGSLRDVLRNRSFCFEGEILLNILKDIATGMVFLHSCKPAVIHRDLRSANIFLDRNLRAKLSNFRLTYRERSRGFPGAPLWMAPEILRGESAPTAASDVYSMGIVMFELFSRERPYSGVPLAEVLDKVADAGLDEPFRPTLPPELPVDVAALIHDCWAPRPELRPSFEEVKSRIERLEHLEIKQFLKAHSNKMPGMVAKVRRNTAAAESLYSQLFPPHVAKALQSNAKVQPEAFECVTVFFCDVVGYTAMSSSMQANDVIDMLERLYAEFDRLALQHDVFKVDTIGDAYLAVTNLHKSQADHAARIGRFAVDAVEAAKLTLIRMTSPGDGHVCIRCGFHSGPVVASVIGKGKPKYTIFGDTVNTASRMESNSEANRVQCTEASATLILPVRRRFPLCPGTSGEKNRREGISDKGIRERHSIEVGCLILEVQNPELRGRRRALGRVACGGGEVVSFWLQTNHDHGSKRGKEFS